MLRREPQIDVGDTATNVVLAIAKRSQAGAVFEFVEYAPYPGVAERLGLRLQQSNAGELLVGASDRRVVAELLRHERRSFQRATRSVSRRTVISGSLPRPSDGRVLAISSRVQLRGRAACAHIPMMDFAVECSEVAQFRVVESVRGLGFSRGVVLASGRSYHFYGMDLLSGAGWLSFMHRSLLLAPLVDVRYVAHRLLERRGILRLTASVVKPTEPRVVQVL